MLTLLISATIPVVFISYFVYQKDTEREPIGLLVRCFGLGMLIVFPILIVELILSAFSPLIPF